MTQKFVLGVPLLPAGAGLGKAGNPSFPPNHVQLADPLFKSLAGADIRAFEERLVTRDVLHADETTVRVVPGTRKGRTEQQLHVALPDKQ